MYFSKKYLRDKISIKMMVARIMYAIPSADTPFGFRAGYKV